MNSTLMLTLSALTLSMAPVAADVLIIDPVTLSPVQDTALFELTPLNNYGTAPNSIVGTTAAGQVGRMLVEFDVAGAIPAGAQINSVTLRLVDVSSPGGIFNSGTFSLHRSLVDWNGGTNVGNTATTGEATWEYRVFETINWGNSDGGASGIDYVASASAGIVLSNVVGGSITLGTNIWGSTPGMVADVQSWLDVPSTNHGWFVISSLEATIRSSRRFGTVDNNNAAVRPLLTVEFTPVPEPTTIGLAGIGAAALFLLRRHLPS